MSTSMSVGTLPSGECSVQLGLKVSSSLVDENLVRFDKTRLALAQSNPVGERDLQEWLDTISDPWRFSSDPWPARRHELNARGDPSARIDEELEECSAPAVVTASSRSADAADGLDASVGSPSKKRLI